VVIRAEAVIRAEVPPDHVSVRPFLSASSPSAYFLQWHCGLEDSDLYGVYKPLPGAFLTQPLPLYAQETEILASCLVGLWHENS